MPLEIVKLLEESKRPQCDIDFLDVQGDRIFSSGDGGKIKIWSKDTLEPIGELDSEQGVCCIALQGNRCYAGMSSGAIVIWDLETSSVIGELKEHDGSILVMHLLNDLLYSGDSEGKVILWKDDKVEEMYEVGEEVWDTVLTENFIYSIRDRDLVIQKIHRTEKGNRLHVMKTVEGRGPLVCIEGKVIMLGRDGMTINILDPASFKRIGTIEGTDRMINSLVSGIDKKKTLYGGGYGCAVVRYDLETLTPVCEVELEHPINCIKIDPTGSGHVFVGGNNGLLGILLDR